MHSARHVIGCHFTQEKRVRIMFIDVAGSICQALPQGSGPAAVRPQHGMPINSINEGSTFVSMM
jgi:hypothetical protein